MSKSITAIQTRILEQLKASRGETREFDPAIKENLANASRSFVGLGLYSAANRHVRHAFAAAERSPNNLEDWLIVLEVALEETLGKSSQSCWDRSRLSQLDQDAAAVKIPGESRTNIAVCRQLILKHPRRYGRLTPKSLSRQLSKARKRFSRSTAVTAQEHVGH